MDEKQVQVVGQNRAWDGFLKLDQYQLNYPTFDGGQTATVSREVLVRGVAVAALPYDPVTDQILLIEQFRIGAFHAEANPWVVEIVAGMMDVDGESPAQTLQRELSEEAGIAGAELEHIVDYFPSPGGSDEQIKLYLARCDLSGLETGQVFGLASETEDIRVHKIPRQDWPQWMAQGRLNNAATLLALMWLDRQWPLL